MGVRGTLDRYLRWLGNNLVGLDGLGWVLADTQLTLRDDADPTKQAVFQASGISTGTTRTLTIPDASGTIALMGDIGLVFIDSATFSAASSVSLDGVFTSEYANYLLVVSPFAASIAANLSLRMRAGGSTHASTYYWGLTNTNSNGVETPAGAANTSEYRLIASGTQVTDGLVKAVIGQPALAAETTLLHQIAFRNATPASVGGYGGGFHNQASAYDGCLLFVSAGTMTGTARIYGYRGA